MSAEQYDITEESGVAFPQKQGTNVHDRKGQTKRFVISLYLEYTSVPSHLGENADIINTIFGFHFVFSVYFPKRF